MFYEIVTIIKEISEDEFGATHLVELNGIHGHDEKYAIAEPGGYYVVSDETAKEIMNG